MPTVREVVWGQLQHHTAPLVFGNPGTTEVPFLHGIPSGMEFVMVPHESAAIGIADGYAQFGDHPVTVVLHAEAGLATGMSNLITACKNHTPLLLIVGQQSRDLLPYDPYLGAGNLPALLGEHLRYVVQAARAEDVPVAINQALRQALAPPGGPAVVVVPADDWDRESTPTLLPEPRRCTMPLDPDTVQRMAHAINAADHPAVVLGAGVARTGPATTAVALAERLSAPVWAAPLAARNVFPEDHHLFAGVLDAQPDSLLMQLSGHDLLLVVGGPAFTFHRPGRLSVSETDWPTILHIDDDQRSLTRGLAGITALASPAPAIHALVPLLNQRTPLRPSPKRTPAPPPPATAAEDGRLSQSTTIAALAEMLPDNTLIVEEAPTARPVIHRHLPIRQGLDFLTMSSGILGYGLPAAVGAALARPDRPVIAIIGDGSMMYTPQALHTAAARDLVNLTVLVLDNHGYAAVRRHAARLNVEVPGTELDGLGFDAIAAGHGIHDIHLAYNLADLKRLLPEVLDYRGPTLLWVDLAPASRPPEVHA